MDRHQVDAVCILHLQRLRWGEDIQRKGHIQTPAGHWVKMLGARYKDQKELVGSVSVKQDGLLWTGEPWLVKGCVAREVILLLCILEILSDKIFSNKIKELTDSPWKRAFLDSLPYSCSRQLVTHQSQPTPFLTLWSIPWALKSQKAFFPLFTYWISFSSIFVVVIYTNWTKW